MIRTDPTTQFLYNLNNNYVIEMYLDGLTTLGPNVDIAPLNPNRVFLAFQYVGPVIPVIPILGFVSNEGPLLPIPLDASGSCNISFHSVLPMQRIRMLQGTTEHCFCYGVIRQMIGGGVYVP